MPDMELDLDVRPSSLRTARRWAVDCARAAGVADRALPVVELLTSELVANAFLHGPVEPVAVRAASRDGSFVVAVRDAGEEMPVVRTTGPEVPGGQGMRLVERLATTWGVDVHPDGGKTVWFAVAVDG